tara:strand:+ start:543 stop:935 length:393 start_codon:yes stop_codon:yes gene_type:complete
MKTSQLKMIIREVVREEIRLGLQEIVGDLKQTKKISQPQQLRKKVVERKNYSKNPIINDVLNETATTDDWETMGNKKYTSNNMSDILNSSYGDMMNKNPNAPVTIDGQTADFLQKDYRSLMKAIDKKQGK